MGVERPRGLEGGLGRQQVEGTGDVTEKGHAGEAKGMYPGRGDQWGTRLPRFQYPSALGAPTFHLRNRHQPPRRVEVLTWPRVARRSPPQTPQCPRAKSSTDRGPRARAGTVPVIKRRIRCSLGITCPPGSAHLGPAVPWDLGHSRAGKEVPCKAHPHLPLCPTASPAPRSPGTQGTEPGS